MGTGDCVATNGVEADIVAYSFSCSWAGLSGGYEADTEKLMSEK